ncbi:glycerate dehydrogenase [Hahella sp. CCB-MM4]|uniref:D-2-hydroxyacid dehydrogenase n=1 Tax=Hahella sp. (strain CCB-MM4) TaxID=1926491 RepID=UPI000B9AA9F7|nr:D-2-hydroxyacid dehydrogenase [Hahella sp. CCB-MM4]OZG71874.1 glycerate dehydrogenase [Hahella sp. CCB-MM4]
MKAVILDADSLGTGVSLQSIEQSVPELKQYPHTLPEQVDERIRGYDVVIVNKVVLSERHMIDNPQLRLIAVTATGTNNIDMLAAEKHGIEVRNVAHYGTATIVQHVYSLILALSNNLLSYTGAVRDGRWHQSQTFCLMDYPIRELAGRKLGVIGYGELGQAVAKVAPAFGLEVLVGARPGGKTGHHDGVDYLPLGELLPQVDILSLHCLLSEDTSEMLNEKTLTMMKPDAILINTARGGLVNEQALADALRAGRLGGAGFDVLTREPPVEGNPLLQDDIPNLIVTPHCAWASVEARQRLIDMTADNIRHFAEHQQLRVPL